jgi:4-aminobutyrate aminotransferase-like enzyme
LERRTRVFGAASVLFYERPLEFVRGEGCWLYAADGERYLDAYNNVPSVGHCHPQVVAAAAHQLGQLNVHTRYLHPGVIAYAERLLQTLPAELSNITFTCTGSESNDLALRLAAAHTGGRGIIVTEAAYHGNTALLTEVSPSSLKRGALPSHVRAVPAPDALRALGNLEDYFATHILEAAEDLRRNGVRLSALLIDSIFSSDGVHADPPGFLATACNVVHSAGGLVIADEVQPGFGRTGTHWWGFQRHGIEPDIVTMGKPMGNGYPIGAVVTRPEILQDFCSKFGYFNTYAGTPVAAAVGQAVLDVIEQEQLQQNAAQVGAELKQGLTQLAARHPEIASVRAAGLYLGIELAHPRDGTPLAERTAAVINAVRDRHVLVGAAGRFGSVIKIRPPLCLSMEQAQLVVSALDEALKATAP